MIKSNSFLNKVKRKLKKFGSNQVVGYLTPVEVVALCKHFGYKPQDLHYYEQRIKKGICNPVYYYFPRKFLGKNVVDAEFARKLERERDELKKQIDEMERLKEARRKRYDADLCREYEAHNKTKRALDEALEEKKMLHLAHFDALKKLRKLSCGTDDINHRE